MISMSSPGSVHGIERMKQLAFRMSDGSVEDCPGFSVYRQGHAGYNLHDVNGFVDHFAFGTPVCELYDAVARRRESV